MAKRRIKKARIKFISLVPAGANQMPVLYKEDGQVELQCLVKAIDDKGELLNVIYAPERTDSQGDIADADVIKAMSYEGMRQGLEIDVRHDLKPLPKDKVFIAESFLVQKSDERFHGWKDLKGNPVGDLSGSWASVIKIDDPKLRQDYRDGNLQGVSMYGQAEFEAVKEDLSNDQFLATLVEKLSPTTDSKDIEMSKEEMEALLAKSEERIAKLVDEKLAVVSKAGETKSTKEDTDPLLFKGDLTNPADVAAHVELLKSVELAKAIDTEDLSQMLTLQKSLGEAPAVSSRVEALEQNLKNIIKGSSVSPGQESRTTMPDVDFTGFEVSKSAAEEIRIGQEMAEAYDRENGYTVAEETS